MATSIVSNRKKYLGKFESYPAISPYLVLVAMDKKTGAGRKTDSILANRDFINYHLLFLSINRNPTDRAGELTPAFSARIIILVLFKDKKLITAILLGITISLKPLPGLVLIYWLLKKEYRVAGIALVTILVLWLIAIPIFGFQNQIQYFRSTAQFTQSLYTNPQQLNNTSFYAFWSETGDKVLQNIGLGKILFYITIGLLGILWLITIIRNRQITPLEYAWTVATPPLLIHYTEMHHFILSLLLYLVAIGIWVKIKNPVAKSGLVISWILVNLGFQLGDVTTIGQSSYLYRYLSLFGILIGWIAGLIMLYPRKSEQV